MAYDGKIVIDTKIDTKEAENDLKKLGELVKSKMNLLTTLVSASSKQMVCSINAKDVKEFNDIVKIAKNAAMSYRMGYVDH